MRYESQKVALVYFAGALLLFAVQILVGTLAGVVYVLPNVLSELAPFNVIRMIHTNSAASGWPPAAQALPTTG
jgi:nitric oxide reductase subunit B